MRHVYLLALLVACDGKTPDTDDTDVTPVDTEEPEDTELDLDTEVDDPEYTLTGTLRDEDGQPITERLRVQYCRNIACRAASIEDGVYTINGIEAGPGSFEVVALDDGSDLVTVFAPLDIGDEDRTVDVVVPDIDFEVAIPASPAALTVADGLTITVGQGQLEAPSPLDPAPTHLAGTVGTDVSLPIEGLTGTLLALYYLMPFDYESSAGMAVTVRNDFGLVDGQAELYAAVYTTYSWEKVGDLVEDGDGGLVLEGGGTIDRITTLAVVQKP
jgi:hypothetical protein